MKRTLLTIGLLSSTLFSAAQARQIFQKYSCVDEKSKASDTLNFYGRFYGDGNYVEYTYLESSGKKKTESIECDALSPDPDLSGNWKCIGDSFEVHIMSSGHNQFQAYVYNRDHGGKHGQNTLRFFCR